MLNITDNDVKSLLTEYEFMNKAYELQFNHFMGVFYFWSAIVGIPISAGIIKNLVDSCVDDRWIFGLWFILIALLGLFISLKMFDLRNSQFRYIHKIIEIREAIWKKLELDIKFNTKPLDSNLHYSARHDFGIYMAWIMSSFHAIFFWIGLSLVFSKLLLLIWSIIIALLCSLVILFFNVRLYYVIFVWEFERKFPKVKVTENNDV